MKLSIAFATGALVAGCGVTGLNEGQQKTFDNYAAEEALCVRNATSKAEGYDCICTVKMKYGRPCPVPTKDGG